ncbi:hypothetical protein GCM10029978_115650 [Actinoallomurus acanthiterrae]
MMDPQQRVLEQRYIEVDDLAKNPALLDGCPHRYVFVAVRRRAGITLQPAHGNLPRLLWCVEMLETRGWEPVAWEFGGGAETRTGALMRRTGSGTPGEAQS